MRSTTRPAAPPAKEQPAPTTLAPGLLVNHSSFFPLGPSDGAVSHVVNGKANAR